MEVAAIQALRQARARAADRVGRRRLRGAPWLACQTGPYAVTLPQHYPTLHKIGRHQVTELGAGVLASAPVTLRRIEYSGMVLDVAVSDREPNRYTLLELSASSRRWHIGRLTGVAPAPFSLLQRNGRAPVHRNGGDAVLGRAFDDAV